MRALLALAAGLSLVACRPGAPVRPSPAGTVATAAVPPALAPSPPPPSSPASPAASAAAQEAHIGSFRLRFQIQNDQSILQIDLHDSHVGSNIFQVLIDADRLAGTGYRVGNLGAELLLENGAMFFYQGSGKDWKWIDITPAEMEFAQSDSGAVWRLPIPAWRRVCAAIGTSCSTVELVARLVDDGWNLLAVSPILVLSIPKP